MFTLESFYEGHNVNNAVAINEDDLLVSLHKKGWNKFIIFNLETKDEKIVIDEEDAYFALDIIKIPSSPAGAPFFIAHTGKGLQLIDAVKKKSYNLNEID